MLQNPDDPQDKWVVLTQTDFVGLSLDDIAQVLVMITQNLEEKHNWPRGLVIEAAVKLLLTEEPLREVFSN